MFASEFFWGLLILIAVAVVWLFWYRQRTRDVSDIPEEHFCSQPTDLAEFDQIYEQRQAALLEAGIDPEPLVLEANSWPAIDRPVLVEDDLEFGDIYATAVEDIVSISPTLVEISQPLLQELKERTDNTAIGHSPGYAQTPLLNVALVADTGSMYVKNPVDLVGLSVVFTRDGDHFFDLETVSPGKYDSSYEKVGGATSGVKIPLKADNASHKYTFTGKLKFRLYNKVYTSIFINSNGNLTFGKGDSRPTIDKWTFRENLPALAPLWTDLDPSQGGDIILQELKDRLVVTWLGVPLKGTQEKCTFQVNLFDDGKTNTILFSYKSAKVSKAVVGISPGDKSHALSQRDLYLSWKPTKESVQGCVVEEFSTHRDVNLVEVAKAFYKDYDDDYDSLVIFSERELTDPSIQYIPLFNDQKGIGQKSFDKRDQYKLKGFSELWGVINMGSAQELNDHPYKLMRKTSGFYGIQIIAHEQGHRWLADVQYWDGSKVQHILRNGFHWLPHVNSRAVVPPWGGQGKNSVMEGSSWSAVKGSSGVFERAMKGNASYGSLDLYLMGLLSSDELNDAWFIQTKTPVKYNQRRVQGKRIDLTPQNLADWDGKVNARYPDINNSQKHFRSAFILVHDQGKKPDPKMVARIARYAAAWEVYFHAFSDSRGLWHTHLSPRKNKFFVDSLGNDTSGDGSQKKPFRTLTKASSVAKAGGTIHIGMGTYDVAAGEKFPIELPPYVWIQGDLSHPTIKGQGSYTLSGKTYQTAIVAPMGALLNRVKVENAGGGVCILFADGEPSIMDCKVTTSGKGTGFLLVGNVIC